MLELGLKIPEDIAIISGQHREVDSAYLAIPITTIDLNMKQQGYNAAEALHKLIQGEQLAAEVYFTQGAKIIQRDSTALPQKGLSKATEYIDQHIGDPITVDQLALKAGISRASLQRQFKETFGCGVATEIRRRRMDQAKALLIESDMSATAIADKLGYSSVAQFYRLFKKESGLTCGEYRELHAAAGSDSLQ
ncbi:MAG: helix-turn-helix domain-containing protein [Akkermansiaceae bacterium]|nr:helix-turn-helix domain-containing protein [Akkermansiaceae bacterium]